MRHLLCLVIVLCGLLTATQPVSAQDCESRIVDEANILRRQTGEVSAAMDRLYQRGADVYLRTYHSFGRAANIAAFSDQLVAQCPSWQNAKGGRKNNLLLIVFTMQPKGINASSGALWHGTVSGVFEGIVRTRMAPSFNNGKFSDGFVAGFSALESEIFSSAPLAERPPSSEKLPPRDVPPPPPPPSVDLSWILPVFIGLGLAVCAVMIGLVITWALRKRWQAAQTAAEKQRRDKDALRAAIQAQDSAARHMQTVPLEHEALEIRAVLLAERVPNSSTVRDIRTRLEEVGRTMNAATSEFGQVNSSYGSLNTDSVPDEELHTRMGERYGAVAAQYAEAEAGLAGLAMEIVDIETRLGNLPNIVTRLEEQAGEGERRIGELRPVFNTLEAGFARQSYESVMGNGSQATACIEQSRQAIQSVRDALSVQPQNLDEALRGVETAEQNLQQADSLLRSITTIAQMLAAARRDAPKEVEKAIRDLHEAKDFERQHDADIDDRVKESLASARGIIDQARTELLQPKPDYLDVSKLAQQARTLTDQILQQCRSEHDTANRLREKSAKALAAAQSRVKKAEEYQEDHDRDIKDSARSKLVEAQTLFADASEAKEPQAIFDLAIQADEAGKRAFQLAQADVRAARPQPERRHTASSPSYSEYQTNVIVVDTGYHHWPPSATPEVASPPSVSFDWGSEEKRDGGGNTSISWGSDSPSNDGGNTSTAW